MKKIMLVISSLILLWFVPAYVQAETYVKLDETNFPDAEIRRTLASDANENGMIDVDRITYLNLANAESGKGIEKLTALESIDIVQIASKEITVDNASVKHVKFILIEGNPDIHLNLPNATKIEIETPNKSQKYITVNTISGLSTCVNLEELCVRGLNQPTLSLKGLEQLKQLNVNYGGTASITDWEGCKNLEEICLYNLSLESLSLPAGLDKVKKVIVRNNDNLAMLDLKGAANIDTAFLQENSSLTSMNLPLNMTELVVYKDPITQIDLSGMRKLYRFRAGGSDLEKIVLGNNSALRIVGLSDTKLSTLDYKQCPNLESLEIGNTKFSGTLDVRKLKKLTRINLEGTSVKKVLLSNQSKKKIDVLGVANCKLKSIDLSKTKNLILRWEYTSYKKNMKMNFKNWIGSGYKLTQKGSNTKLNVRRRVFQLKKKGYGGATFKKRDKVIRVDITPKQEQY